MAAEASECANDQGMFWEFHDMIFNNHAGENVGTYSPNNLLVFASELNMDINAFESCMEAQTYRDYVIDQTNSARSLGVGSTPTLIINGELLVGLMGFAAYEAAIEVELAAIDSAE